MKITNPKECKTAPSSFSEESKIADIETADNLSGIILDSPREVAKALIMWGHVGKSKATQRFLMTVFNDKYEGINEALRFIGEGEDSLDYQNRAYNFIKKLAEEALSELESERHFYKKLDYYERNEINFFGVSNIYVKQIGDKYVLDSFQKPEKLLELAEILSKPKALVSSRVKGRLSVVDDWWFNVNLEDLLKHLPISKKRLKGLSKSLVPKNKYYEEESEKIFEYKKQKFSLGIYLAANGEEDYYKYLQARGKSIVGQSWISYAENGNDRIDPKAVQRELVFLVSLPKGEIAITKDQMNAVQSARNYIAYLLAPDLLPNIQKIS